MTAPCLSGAGPDYLLHRVAGRVLIHNREMYLDTKSRSLEILNSASAALDDDDVDDYDDDDGGSAAAAGAAQYCSVCLPDKFARGSAVTDLRCRCVSGDGILMAVMGSGATEDCLVVKGEESVERCGHFPEEAKDATDIAEWAGRCPKELEDATPFVAADRGACDRSEHVEGSDGGLRVTDNVSGDAAGQAAVPDTAVSGRPQKSACTWEKDTLIDLLVAALELSRHPRADSASEVCVRLGDIGFMCDYQGMHGRCVLRICVCTGGIPEL